MCDATMQFEDRSPLIRGLKPLYGAYRSERWFAGPVELLRQVVGRAFMPSRPPLTAELRSVLVQERVCERARCGGGGVAECYHAVSLLIA